jgi:sugar phosphate isomerase/epimerase
VTAARIYACTWSLFPVMGPVEAARFAARNGFQGLEINCDPLDFWPGLVNEAILAELVAIGKGEGVGFTLYNPSAVNPASLLPEEQIAGDEIIKRAAETAVRLGSPVLCIHPGVIAELFSLERHGVPFSTGRYDRESLRRQAWRRAAETIGRWADLLTPAGLKLVVENEVHVRYTAAPTAQSLADMVEAAGRPNVKVNFDTGHAFVGGGLAEEFAVLEPYIAHVHLNDNQRKVSEHLPLGMGRVEFASIADFLATLDAALVLEIYAPERPVAAMLESRDYILRLIAQVSGLSRPPEDRRK